MNTFSFQGGVIKPRSHVTEKMFAFVITPQGHEIMLYDAMRNGIVSRIDDAGNTTRELSIQNYVTILKYIKIFVHREGHQVGKSFCSWHIELGNEHPEVTIYSHSLERGGLFFKANCKILTPEEVEELFDLSEETKTWLRNDRYRPPVELMSRMVTEKAIDPKAAFRKIRIRRD